MARSATETLLPLDRYAVVMNLNPYHFNNLDDGKPAAGGTAYWNQGHVEELALYISQAEMRMREGQNQFKGLDYDVAPRFYRDLINYYSRSAQWWLCDSVRTNRGHVEAFGHRVLTSMENGVSVNYADDTGTITLTGVSDVNSEDVVVFYRVVDGATEAADDAWQIRPLTVLIDGTTVTITGHKSQFVKPSIPQGPTCPGGLSSDDDNFVGAVDVYQETIDLELPLALQWDAIAIGKSTDPTVKAEQTGAALLIDGETGLFLPRPATYINNAHTFVDPTYGGSPGFIAAEYRAGYPYTIPSQRRMDARLENAIVRLTNVMTPDFGLWLSDFAQRKWRDDRQMPSDDNPLNPNELDNPFGYTNGARAAWLAIQSMKLYQSPI